MPGGLSAARRDFLIHRSNQFSDRAEVALELECLEFDLLDHGMRVLDLLLHAFQLRLGLGRAPVGHGQVPRELALEDLDLIVLVYASLLAA